MLKGLFYCHYFVGLGHLARSLNLCRELVKIADIDFISGGYPTSLTLSSDHFHKIDLTPLPPSPIPHEVKEARQKQLQALTASYDFLITEFFPFSKWMLKEEVESLIQQIKKSNPSCRVYCSLRDSFPKPSEAHDREIADFIDHYYDKIFVHADQRVYQLNESFAFEEEIKEKVVYTGFLANPEANNLNKTRKKRIVVTIGAGSFGHELLYAVASVTKQFPDYHFDFVLGPKTPQEVADKLREEKSDNVDVLSFMQHFQEYLAESALSINLGGYTIIDAIQTKTPCLAYPSTFIDQYIRILKFSAFHHVRPLTAEELEPQKLVAAIEQALTMTPSPYEVDVDGAHNTCQQIFSSCESLT